MIAVALGNKAVTFAANVPFDSYISDLESGYEALRADLWRRLNLQGNRFDIEPDITGRVLRLGYCIHEVPIRYYARSREERTKGHRPRPQPHPTMRSTWAPMDLIDGTASASRGLSTY